LNGLVGWSIFGSFSSEKVREILIDFEISVNIEFLGIALGFL
jgi:hypothetical protein